MKNWNWLDVLTAVIIILVLALLLLAPLAHAQEPSGPIAPVAHPVERLDRIYEVREKLILEYVPTYAWGVSVCGGTTEEGEDVAWLCMYAYKDSLREFSKVLVNASAVSSNGVIFVDGVPIQAIIIERPKKKR